MNLKQLLIVGTAALGFAATPAAAVHYTYVGSWAPDNGPYWGSNPLAYSGVGAAALLFGGSASDYAISTVDSDPAHINFLANYEVIGIGSRVFADNYFRGVEGVTHYQDVYVFDEAIDTVSTYVSDFGNSNVNYAFSVSNTPEPATWALMIGGFGLVGASLRRRSTTVAA